MIGLHQSVHTRVALLLTTIALSACNPKSPDGLSVKGNVQAVDSISDQRLSQNQLSDPAALRDKLIAAYEGLPAANDIESLDARRSAFVSRVEQVVGKGDVLIVLECTSEKNGDLLRRSARHGTVQVAIFNDSPNSSDLINETMRFEKRSNAVTSQMVNLALSGITRKTTIEHDLNSESDRLQDNLSALGSQMATLRLPDGKLNLRLNNSPFIGLGVHLGANEATRHSALSNVRYFMVTGKDPPKNTFDYLDIKYIWGFWPNDYLHKRSPDASAWYVAVPDFSVFPLCLVGRIRNIGYIDQEQDKPEAISAELTGWYLIDSDLKIHAQRNVSLSN